MLARLGMCVTKLILMRYTPALSAPVQVSAEICPPQIKVLSNLVIFVNMIYKKMSFIVVLIY